MNWVRQRVLGSVGRQGQRRLLHNYHAPSESLKTKIAELGKMRRRRSSKKDKQSVFVEVPESMTYLDTATMPQILTAVGIALFAKLLMMYDDSRSQELIERKIKNAPAEQGTVRMLSREEWEEIREVRPRTPFESKLARPNARLRTGEPLRMEDVKDWTIDVLTDAFARVEESVRHTSKKYTSKNHHKAMVAKAGGKRMQSALQAPCDGSQSLQRQVRTILFNLLGLLALLCLLSKGKL